MTATATKNAPAPTAPEPRPTVNAQNEFIRNLQKAMPEAKHITVSLDDVWVDRTKNLRSVDSDTYSDESIDDLAQTIQAVGGLLQPVTVIPIAVSPDTDNKKYGLMFGFRRWAALQKLAAFNSQYGTGIPAILIDEADTEPARKLIQFIENGSRKEMNPLEKAMAIKTILNDPAINLRNQDVAAMLGMSTPAVSQHLSLLRFPREVQDLISSGKLSFSHAREMMSVVPEIKWVEVAKTGSTMAYGEFVKMINDTYNDTATEGDGTAASKDGGQKQHKMLKPTEIVNSFIPFLQERVKGAEATKKEYTAKDVETARLEAFQTVTLQATKLATDIQPFLEKQKKEEADAELAKEKTEKFEDFLKTCVKEVDSLVNAPVDKSKPDAERMKLSAAYAAVTQKVYAPKTDAEKAEQKKTLGFDLPATAKDFLTKLQEYDVKVTAEKKAAAEKKKKAAAEKAAAEAAKTGPDGTAVAPVGTEVAAATAAATPTNEAAPAAK